MKQFILLTILFILLPCIIVTYFMENDKTEELISLVEVRVKRNQTGKIENIALEDYIVGVVAGEMPVTFHIEALKAQAVAARTYVLKRIEYNKDKEYDVIDTVLNQVYLDNDTLKKSWQKNYEANYKKIYEAVSMTQGEYLEYEGKVIDAMFFSTSNGYTENSGEIFQVDLPYLQSVESAWDEETSPVFEDLETFSLEEFYRKLDLDYQKKLSISITEKTSTGRCLAMVINGVKFSANDFYRKLGLRSTDFDITMENNTVYIKTKGYGHGVGMSQYGAYAMANKGYSYDEILEYYYQGVDIKKLK